MAKSGYSYWISLVYHSDMSRGQGFSDLRKSKGPLMSVARTKKPWVETKGNM